jgi:hypothetical protein
MTGIIKIRQRPDEASRSPDKSCRWIAECDLDGEHYEAQARLDAPNALARLLVDIGVADLQVVLITAGVRGEMTYPSLHRMAQRTIVESLTTPIRSTKWRPPTWDIMTKTGVEWARPSEYQLRSICP